MKNGGKAHHAVGAGLSLATSDRHLGAKLASAKTGRQSGNAVFTDGGRGRLDRGNCLYIMKVEIHYARQGASDKGKKSRKVGVKACCGID